MDTRLKMGAWELAK